MVVVSSFYLRFACVASDLRLLASRGLLCLAYGRGKGKGRERREHSWGLTEPLEDLDDLPAPCELQNHQDFTQCQQHLHTVHPELKFELFMNESALKMFACICCKIHVCVG